MNIFGWIYKQSWMNIIVWYAFCTALTLTAMFGGIHHMGYVWLPFTIVLLIKLVKNPKDNIKIS